MAMDRKFDWCNGGSLSVMAAALAAMTAAAPAMAQDEAVDATTDTFAEAIVVTGSRRATRSVTDLPSPVDVLDAEQLLRQGSSDTANLMRTLVPSLNINDNPLSAAAASVRPVVLRGMSPDHTLVLVNGKRRHRSADIPTFSGGISDGSQGPDISSIPSIALSRVEVLRDGAAAQYGSDAIAGVVNFVMNDDPEGGTLQARYGQTYEGDGDTYQIAGTVGFRLGDTGFLRLSGEFSEAGATTRAVQRGDAAALQAAGYPDVPDPATRFGTPRFSNNLKTFLNGAVETGFGGELYLFGGYAQRTATNDFFYRNPTGRGGIYTDDDEGGNYLIGDMDPTDGINCDGGIDFGGTGVVNNPIGVGDADAAQRLAAIMATPGCFTTLSYYPGGYSPLFGTTVRDLDGTIGLRGDLSDRLAYDVSFGAGRQRIDIFVSNSINPSLGSNSPTSFKDGTQVQTELLAEAGLTYEADFGLASPLIIAGGAQWHLENYEIRPGEPDSYQAGVLAEQGFFVGEEAQIGYSARNSGNWKRSNYSLYLDVEGNLTDALVFGLAGRFEDFTDFGSQFTYKVSGLYHLTDQLALRSTYATGFHAPTPGQQNFTTMTTELSADGTLIDSGFVSPNSVVAQTVGAVPLKPEKSKSFSAGLTWDSPGMTITLDYFNIQMKDRLTQSASYELTDVQRDQLAAEGYLAASRLGTFRFFTNDFSSTTQGVDLVVNVPLPLTPAGRTNFSIAGNYTENKVTSYDPNDPNELLSETRVVQLEEMTPKWRGYATLTHEQGPLFGLLRVNYYGKFTELHVNALDLPIYAPARVTVDAQASYDLSDAFTLTIGADNVFNTFPGDNPWADILGSKYPTTAPSGINGGFYYAQIAFNF